MAEKKQKQKKAPKEEARLLKSAIDQIIDGWEKCEERFMSALDDSDKKRIVLHFDVTLDKALVKPIVDVKLSWKDKERDGGIDVMKTFSCASSAELDDPKQPRLIPDGDLEAGSDPG